MDEKKNQLLIESEHFLKEYERIRRGEIEEELNKNELNLRLQIIAPLEKNIDFLRYEIEKQSFEDHTNNRILAINDLNNKVDLFKKIYLKIFFDF